MSDVIASLARQLQRTEDQIELHRAALPFTASDEFQALCVVMNKVATKQMASLLTEELSPYDTGWKQGYYQALTMMTKNRDYVEQRIGQLETVAAGLRARIGKLREREEHLAAVRGGADQ